jgi:chemotaxis protein histidine kinase CheA
MTNHEEIRGMLAAMAGNDLSASDRQMVEHHLTECQSCSIELTRLQTMVKALRETPELDPPPWLASRIMARIRDGAAARHGWFARIFLPLHVKLPLEGLALIMIGVIAWQLFKGAERPIEINQAATSETASMKDADSKKRGRSESAVATKSRPEPQEKKPVAAVVPKLPVEPVQAQKPSVPASAYAPPPQVSADRVSERVERAKTASEAAPMAPAASREQVAGAAAPTAERKMVARHKSEIADNNMGVAVRQPLKMRLVTENRGIVTDQLRRIVQKLGGSMVDSRTGSAVVRVDAWRVTELLDQVGRLGRITEGPVGEMPRDGWVELQISW